MRKVLVSFTGLESSFPEISACVKKEVDGISFVSDHWNFLKIQQHLSPEKLSPLLRIIHKMQMSTVFIGTFYLVEHSFKKLFTETLKFDQLNFSKF